MDTARHPIGVHVYSLFDGLTLNGGHVGVCYYNSHSADATVTLPAIAADGAPEAQSGLWYDIVNTGSYTLTVQTSSSQLFNGVSSKTSYSVPAGGTLRAVAIWTGSAGIWMAVPGGGTS